MYFLVTKPSGLWHFPGLPRTFRTTLCKQWTRIVVLQSLILLDSWKLLHSFYLMLLTSKIANSTMCLSRKQSIWCFLNTFLVKSKLCTLYFLFLQAEEVETYLENLKEKKGLSGKYQTSSKLFQNCSELFKTQVIFDNGWREIEEVKCLISVFLVIPHFPLPNSLFWQK